MSTKCDYTLYYNVIVVTVHLLYSNTLPDASEESYYTGVSMILKGGFTLTITLIVFIGILCAMMNSFSGLASIYFFNSENNNAKFTLDIKKKEK